MDAYIREWLKLFGRLVNFQRNFLGMSQELVASLAGLSRTELNHLESGTQDHKISTFIRICITLMRGPGEVASHLEHLVDHPEDRPPESPRKSQRGKNTRRSL